MWIWIGSAAIALALGIGISASVRAAVPRRRRREAIEAFLASPADQRAERMQVLVDRDSDNAAVWYLLGCAHLADCRTTDAARAFAVAHHRDCRLETAALFTFACLKATSGKESDILDQLLDTWREMNQPDVMRKAEDRQMVEGLTAAEPPPASASALGRLMWLAIGPEHRATMQDMLTSTDPRWAPLRQPSD